MRIAIVAPLPVPYIEGGAEAFWRGLRQAFAERTTHRVELIKLPVREFTLPDLMASYRAFSRLDLSPFDLVISSKYPAWMVDHPNHVVYMQHKLRGLYDTYDRIGIPRLFTDPGPGADVLVAALRREGTPPAAIYDAFDRALAVCGADHPWFGFPSPLARELIHVLDRWGMSPKRVARYLSLSEAVARRDDYFPLGAPVEVIPHPPDLGGFHSTGYDHIFTVSRLDRPKRIDLIVTAMRHVAGPMRLIVAGTGPDEDRLRALAGDDPRIEFRGRVNDDEKRALYAGALVVPFVPLDEDMGLITQEAMLSGKPVITATDSGGAAELVRDGVNGLICEPDPHALAAAITGLVRNRERARVMGERGRMTAGAITWERLTSALVRGRDLKIAYPEPAWTGRPRVVVVAPYVVHTKAHGGALRCHHIGRGLLGAYDVHIVSLGDRYATPENVEIEPGMVETVVPITESFLERERGLFGDVGMPISDITAAGLHMEAPHYAAHLRRALAHAELAVLAHPYLVTAVRAAGPGVPMIYDAHNAEFAMKRSLLPENEPGRRLAELVHHVEGRAVRESALTVVCSPDDQALLSAEFHAPASRFAAVPNGVGLEDVPFTTGVERVAARRRWLSHHRPADGRTRHRDIALFIGSWHPPNLEAAEQIFSLAPSFPDVVFVVVGGMGTYFKDWAVPANVALVGRVSEAAKLLLLRSASVALNPMLSGGGSNLKIIEYMAAGVPVVTTPIGSRGVAAEAGIHHAAASMGRFDAAIREVLSNPRRAEERALHARQLVEGSYSWRLLGNRICALVTQVIVGDPPSHPGSADGR